MLVVTGLVLSGTWCTPLSHFLSLKTRAEAKHLVDILLCYAPFTQAKNPFFMHFSYQFFHILLFLPFVTVGFVVVCCTDDFAPNDFLIVNV